MTILHHHLLFSIFRWMKMLIMGFFFFFLVGGGTWQTGGGEREDGEGFYWLVSLYSVDCDKFNCGSPLKADASPDTHPPPPQSPLPLRLFPLSFSRALWGRSVWLDIRCLLRANGHSGCLFLLHGSAAETHDCYGGRGLAVAFRTSKCSIYRFHFGLWLKKKNLSPPEYDGGSSQTSATIKGIMREVFSVGGLTFQLRRCQSVKPAIKASASGAVNPPRTHSLTWLAPQTLYFPSQTERRLNCFFCPQRTQRKTQIQKEIPDNM